VTNQIEMDRRVRSDYERDDVASDAMLRGLRAAADERKKAGKLPTPRPPAPTRWLVEMLLEIGCIDGRSGARGDL
jgi:hypothetical protein